MGHKDIILKIIILKNKHKASGKIVIYHFEGSRFNSIPRPSMDSMALTPLFPRCPHMFPPPGFQERSESGPGSLTKNKLIST